MDGSATLTTVMSTNATDDPSTAAARTQRPAGSPYRRPWSASAEEAVDMDAMVPSVLSVPSVPSVMRGQHQEHDRLFLARLRVRDRYGHLDARSRLPCARPV